MSKATVFDINDARKPFIVTDEVLHLNLINAFEEQGPVSQKRKVRKYHPSIPQIGHVLPEDYAKLKYNGEYFWVKVDQVNFENRLEFVGLVDYDLTFSKIYRNDQVYFEYFNVFDIRSQEWRNHDHI